MSRFQTSTYLKRVRSHLKRVRSPITNKRCAGRDRLIGCRHDTALRIEYEGAVQHVMSRGIDGQAIVRDDGDRERWLSGLSMIADRFGWQIFCFALKDHHFHLFLQTPRANLAAGMRALNGNDALFFNRRRGRRGPVGSTRLVEAAARALGLDAWQADAQRRDNGFTRPLLAYLCRRHTAESHRAISEQLGYRNPSSVGAACLRVEKSLASGDAELTAMRDVAEKGIGECCN